ncbi:helix-turn-helix domain-containing protein [Taibaiella koreensis]|uniref:helix-turn-helix domain-containing protein n=1 Tax=Taibaiella koreensis TaxID=1268548 RepID=UPI000E59CEE7|nr:helix-turn-helix domain-containing protein [Taibaiella koreensis]
MHALTIPSAGVFLLISGIAIDYLSLIKSIDRPVMNYQQLLPPESLRTYVRYYWVLEYTARDGLPHAFAPLADGCPGLIYQQSDTGVYFDREGKTLPPVFLYGQTIRPAAICMMGRFRMIGACLAPDALRSVFGLNAAELTDTCTDLDAIAARRGIHLSERMLYSLNIPSQLGVLSAYLEEEIGKNKRQSDALTQQALLLILQSRGAVSLRELQRQANLSERTFERRFNQYVGISPKLFAKVCRFQSSLVQLKSNRYEKLSDIAYDNGFADQSHFIRTFKEFAGYAPYEFQRQSYGMAENFPLLRK